MKKVFLGICLMFLATLSIANVQKVCDGIILQVRFDDPTEDYEPLHRDSIEIPFVSLDNHTLFFLTPCDGCTLRLLDDNANVVYSTVIASGTTSLVLPSTLSGEYEIQIIQGNIYFYGTIYL